MFTIESTSWDRVKLFWEKWKNYDITVPTFGLNIDKVYVDLDSVLKQPFDNFTHQELNKTLGFYQDGILRGTCTIKDTSTIAERRFPRLVGIANMAIDPAYRNNGIGTELMKVVDMYISNNDFNLSILYPSVYSQEIKFYSKFGYIPYGDTMIKSYAKSNISKKDLDKYIQQIGKF